MGIGSKVTINGVEVTTADVMASNGIIHVIDGVLMPPADGPGNIAEVATEAGSFTVLLGLLTKAGLADTIASGGPFTVFAPTDQAFADAVRSIDPTRPIFSGDAMPRPSAYHNFQEGSWKTDSLEQWEEMFLQDNAAMDGLSAHFYYFSLEDKHHDVGYMEYGPEKQLSFMMEISRRAKKPLFIKR